MHSVTSAILRIHSWQTTVYLTVHFFILDGPGSSISFNPANESITKILSGSLGPIVCSATCNPACHFHWLKPDGTVVDGSSLNISSLSKNDNGTFTCHTGNGYGNNAAKNLIVTVNCKCLILKFDITILIMSAELPSKNKHNIALQIEISKKNRQHNGQKKKYKKTKNDLQNIHIKLKIE